MITTTMTADDFAALAAEIGDDNDVAAAFEVNRVTVHRWKTGKRDIPGPARVLARILGEHARKDRQAEEAEVARLEKLRARSGGQ